jgi:hypothetical protein
VEILEGANHGFTGGGWTSESMVERLAASSSAFISSVSSGESDPTTA